MSEYYQWFAKQRIKNLLDANCFTLNHKACTYMENSYDIFNIQFTKQKRSHTFILFFSTRVYVSGIPYSELKHCHHSLNRWLESFCSYDHCRQCTKGYTPDQTCNKYIVFDIQPCIHMISVLILDQEQQAYPFLLAQVVRLCTAIPTQWVASHSLAIAEQQGKLCSCGI